MTNEQQRAQIRLMCAEAAVKVAVAIEVRKIVKYAKSFLRWQQLVALTQGQLVDTTEVLQQMRRTYRVARKEGVAPARLAVIARYGKLIAS